MLRLGGPGGSGGRCCEAGGGGGRSSRLATELVAEDMRASFSAEHILPSRDTTLSSLRCRLGVAEAVTPVSKLSIALFATAIGPTLFSVDI